jgi:hypothetical protein
VCRGPSKCSGSKNVLQLTKKGKGTPGLLPEGSRILLVKKHLRKLIEKFLAWDRGSNSHIAHEKKKKSQQEMDVKSLGSHKLSPKLIGGKK